MDYRELVGLIQRFRSLIPASTTEIVDKLPRRGPMFRMFRLDVSIAHARVSKQGHKTDLPKYNTLLLC